MKVDVCARLAASASDPGRAEDGRKSESGKADPGTEVRKAESGGRERGSEERAGSAQKTTPASFLTGVV